MKSPSFHEVLERFHKGETMEEQAFDMSLFQAAEKLKKKYDIRYDPAKPVPADGEMADRCFQAGRELYAEVGTYCLSTHRVARFSMAEIDAAMAEAPEVVTWGLGDDQVAFCHRPVESDVGVFVYGGLQTVLYSDEDTMRRVYRACCRCRATDGVCGGIVPILDGGYEIIGCTGQEIFPYRQSVKHLRQAAAEVGRPGMCIRNSAPTPVALVAEYAGAEGIRPSDGMAINGKPELKIDSSDLDRVAFALAIDSRRLGGISSAVGGFSGSVEGAAIVGVAGAYQMLLVNRAEVVACLATHIRVRSRSVRSVIWVNCLTYQALNRNSRLIVAGAFGDHPAAGPGTAQYFHETAAAIVPCIVSGGSPIGGTRKFTIGKTLDYATPLESEFHSRLSKAAVGMDLGQANKLAVYLLELYEDNLQNAPVGSTLHELYDLKSEQPLPAYRKLYDQVTAELRDMGVPIDNYEAP